MKKFTFLCIIILMGLTTIAQTPQAINYQAVARAADGDPVVNQEISVKISILAESASGEVVYSEAHSVTTNGMGLFNLAIGNPAQVLSGIFDDIAWGASDYFLKVEMDDAGGPDYQLLGISQLLSVPYALYSENTAHPEDADADPANELQMVEEVDYEVTLSQGGGSFMTGVKSYTQAEIDDMTLYNGLTVHNSTTNCINYYYLNNWFEACGTCTPMPSQANAGNNQAFYDNTLNANLEANSPEHGTGLWTVETGDGGSFDNATSPTATFTGQHCTDYTLAWTISNSCGSSTDNVDVTFFATPTAAFAGSDTVVQGGDVTLYLSANTPEIGEGLWSVVSGEGGTFDDATNPATLFTGLPGMNYILQWEISTVCDTVYDDVEVLFATLQIGVEYQGGIIAYILQPGDPGYIDDEIHGIIAAASDQSTGATWGCYGAEITGADGTALGTGNQNTIDIVTDCPTAGIAARICNELELNEYDDWFLPSKDELNKLYLSKDIIGGFGSWYWSSSEYSIYTIWIQNFNNGTQDTYGKDGNYRIRATRTF